MKIAPTQYLLTFELDAEWLVSVAEEILDPGRYMGDASQPHELLAFLRSLGQPIHKKSVFYL